MGSRALVSFSSATLVIVVATHLIHAAPLPPPKRRPELAELARQARSQDEAKRRRAIGLLLKYIKHGRTREDIEDLLGPPHERLEQANKVTGKTRAIYYASLPPAPGRGAHRVWVIYDTTSQPWKCAGLKIGPQLTPPGR
jgi:hypothetical protein